MNPSFERLEDDEVEVDSTGSSGRPVILAYSLNTSWRSRPGSFSAITWHKMYIVSKKFHQPHNDKVTIILQSQRKEYESIFWLDPRDYRVQDTTEYYVLNHKPK